MYIFQPDRFLLEKQIKKYSHYLSGKLLDIGAGRYSRYDHLFKVEEYLKLDIEHSDNVDLVASAEDIPFLAETFDSVICTQVFEHLNNPFKAAYEISRILKIGGVCLLTVPQVNELHNEPHDYFRYTMFGLEEIFNKIGLEIIEFDRRGGFFTLIAQLKTRYLSDRLQLHRRKFFGRVASKIFSIYGKFMMVLDKLDKSDANHKHTIGWCVVLRKKEKI